MKQYRLLDIILVAVLLSSCTTIPGDPSDDGSRKETWEVQPYYGELRLMPTEITEQETIAAPTASPTVTAPPATPTNEPAARQIGRMLEVASIPEDLSSIQQLIIRDEAPFLRTEEAIHKLTEAGWSPYLEAFDGDFVGMDYEANVWISRGDGANIGRWDGQNWQIYGDEAGWTAIPPSYGRAVPAQRLVVDSQNQMWLTTSNDVRSFDGQTWTVFSAEEIALPLPDNPDEQWATFTLASSPHEDTIWVGQCYWIGPGPSGGNGVSIYDGQSWQPVAGKSAKGCVNEITPGTNGDMWFNTDSTIWQYEAQKGLFHDFEAPVLETWRYGWVVGLAVDEQGRPWPTFVTCGGASCYGLEDQYQLAADNTWVPMSMGDLGGPWPLLVDQTGTTWYFRGRQVIEVTEEGLTVLADPEINTQHVTQDNSNRVWFVGTLENQPAVWMVTQP